MGYIVKPEKLIWGSQETDEMVRGKTIEMWRYLV